MSSANAYVQMPSGKSAPHPGPQHRITFAGLVRSEWIKFWSVRSLVVCVLLAAVTIVGLSALLAAGSVLAADGADGDPSAATGFPVESSMIGAQVATLVVAAIGVICITGEFSTGAIRTTFTVVPRRLPVLWAKAVTLMLAVTVVLGASVVAAFILGQVMASGIGGGLGFGSPGVLRILLGNVFVLAGTAVAALGVGALLRSAAGAICSLLGLMFVVPTVLAILPVFPGKDLLVQYNFANTATALTTTVAGQTGAPSAPAGAVGFLAWVVVLLACGALALRRRNV